MPLHVVVSVCSVVGSLHVLEPMPPLATASVCSAMCSLHVLEPMPPIAAASVCSIVPPSQGGVCPWPPIFLNYSPSLKSYLSLFRIFFRRHHPMLRRHNRIITLIIIKFSKTLKPQIHPHIKGPGHNPP